jgi:hypothetical protein
MRRRRLDAFRNSPPWPGKSVAQAREEAQYDHCLMVAARMLELPVPEQEPARAAPFRPQPAPCPRTGSGGAGLNVFGPRLTSPDDLRDDGDPIF